MKFYIVKAEKIRGTNFREIYKKARRYYESIKSNTKRKPYIRSAYFKGEKIFLDLFWSHLFDKKSSRDRKRRLIYFPCGIELIKNSFLKPISKENAGDPSEILHRFIGKTDVGDVFFVQIKESRRSDKKFLISIFPINYTKTFR